MAEICPTITAANPHQYRTQIEQVEFAPRLHIDISDGDFAPKHLIDPSQLWWPMHHQVDIHVMYREPETVLEQLISLKPSLIILHAEAKGNFSAFADRLHASGIKVGLALLQPTKAELIGSAMNEVDHVLIFSGSLGQFGGQVEPVLLDKIETLKRRRPNVEIGWDGGITAENIGLLRSGGVEVFNVGGYIHHAKDPQAAYATLKEATEKKVAK